MIHGLRGRALAGLALAIALSSPAEAQGPLTLRDAVLLARDNSLSAQASREQLAGAQATRQATIARAFPTLSLSTSPTYSSLPPAVAAVFGGGAFGSLNIPGFPAEGTYTDTTVAGSMVLFDAFATQDAIKIADTQVLMQRLATSLAEQDAETNAAVAYFDVLRAEGLADVARKTLQQAQEHLRIGNLRLQAGTGTNAEVLQLRAQAAQAQGGLTAAMNAVNLARLNLANVLNAPLGNRPLDAEPPVPKLAVSVETALRQNLAQRPELQQAQLKEQLDQTQVGLTSRSLWPTLVGHTSYSFRGLAQGIFAAGVTLDWTLFDSFRTRDTMEAERHQAQADALLLQQTRQRLALEVRQQYENREDAFSRETTAQEGLAAAQEAYRLALDRFRAGVAAPYELTDVQTTLIQSENAYVQALDDYRVAEIRLARALGVDVASFLGAAR